MLRDSMPGGFAAGDLEAWLVCLACWLSEFACCTSRLDCNSTRSPVQDSGYVLAIGAIMMGAGRG